MSIKDKHIENSATRQVDEKTKNVPLWAKIDALIMAKKIDEGEAHLLHKIAALTNTWGCFKKNVTLAKECGKSIRTIQYRLELLLALGLITIVYEDPYHKDNKPKRVIKAVFPDRLMLPILPEKIGLEYQQDQ